MYLIHVHFGYMFLSSFTTEQNKVDCMSGGLRDA